MHLQYTIQGKARLNHYLIISWLCDNQNNVHGRSLDDRRNLMTVNLGAVF